MNTHDTPRLRHWIIAAVVGLANAVAQMIKNGGVAGAASPATK